jgi:polygalacturonase
MRHVFGWIGGLAVVFGVPLAAQDTRHVVEPKIPAACARLSAQLTSVGGGLAAADESKLDTERIQKAIDGCGKGLAVALEPEGGHNAFVSGPLQLRAGVTLVVDKGVTLYESVDPHVLEVSPGSCGVVNDAPGRGCRPLIAVDHVAGAGVMGAARSTAAAGSRCWAAMRARGSWPNRRARAAARR